MVFFLVVISNLSFFMMWINPTTESVILSIKIQYIGGCFLPWFIAMCVLSLCKIPVKGWIRGTTFTLNAFLYATILTIGKYDLYYKDFYIEKVDGAWVSHKVYGPMHTVFYVFIAAYFVVSFAAVIYSLFKKKEVSRTVLYLLFIPLVLSMTGYLVNKLNGQDVELIPVTYVLAQFVYLVIVGRMTLYEVTDVVVESMVRSGETGFITLGPKGHYLGSNETAKRILPELKDVAVDRSVFKESALSGTVAAWLAKYKNDNVSRSSYTVKNPDTGEEIIYSIEVNDLHAEKNKGYRILITDDTKNQKYLKLMSKYNTQLKDEVSEKTKSIEKMHDNLILSMAAMVESRDNSTGGHIRRTSEGVRILLDELGKENRAGLPAKFVHDVIKAAPMHDLGKVAVDDVILRKPGRFTDEEFEIMKKHAAEGARIVREILEGTDDESFKKVAENVAHYHHERWDGSGYPEGLKGTDIPFEARIMAIADVYDALVSVRVYKPAMSFEEADAIIMGDMGTKFDPGLRNCYISARPRLEEYYRTMA